MTKPSLAHKVFSVLVDHADDSDYNKQILNKYDIAEEIMGDAWVLIGPEMQEDFAQKVRSSINYAMSLAIANGERIITKRAPTQLDPRRKHSVIGWKIMRPGDEEIIKEELIYKKRKGEEHDESYHDLASGAIDKGLISPKDLKKLTKGEDQSNKDDQ